MSSGPTVDGFTAFLRGVANIPALALPDNSPVIPAALQIAMGIVNPQLQGFCAPAVGSLPSISFYTLAVYNLATDRVVNYAPDQTDRNYFAELRERLKLDLFVPGVISSEGSTSTSTAMATPDYMKTLSFRDLQTLKTPWGREYMMIAQDTAQLWGIS